jgi:hypothetical protein
MDNREFWLKMGYGEAEIDEFLRECEADREAFKAWWDGLPKEMHEQIKGEVSAEEDRLNDLEECPVNFEDVAERTVYGRHGFRYPHGNVLPRMSEKQANRFVELVVKDTVFLKEMTVIPFKKD